jgi:hypothetical protein
MKFVDRPFTDPDLAARKLVEIANDVNGSRTTIPVSFVAFLLRTPSGCGNIHG